MKLIPVHELFDVKYGVNLELNKLVLDPDGINFVSRTAKNNGVSARVKAIPSLIPNPPRTISVAGGGSVMESFLQTEPYYSGRDLYYLLPKENLKDMELLYYCACLRANKYRFNYGRQANRTLKELLIPLRSEIPHWINESDINKFDTVNACFHSTPTPPIDLERWLPFKLSDIFTLKKGKRLTKANMKAGTVPFIGSIDSNNGYRQFIIQKAIHSGNTITVNYNGSVAEAFYQPFEFWASDDVNVLYPKFQMNQYSGLFIVSLIKLEKYRFNYGRKWHLERMKESEIRLPVTKQGSPDIGFMEEYIKTLNYSKSI
jgi:hypothetical protein